MNVIKTGAVLALLLAASGCTTSSPQMSDNRGPAPLRPAPTGQVASSQLPPPPAPPPPVSTMPTTDSMAQPDAAAGANPAASAAPTQTASAAPVTREGALSFGEGRPGGHARSVILALNSLMSQVYSFFAGAYHG